jgi:hypothetical protein
MEYSSYTVATQGKLESLILLRERVGELIASGLIEPMWDLKTLGFLKTEAFEWVLMPQLLPS